MTEITSIKVTPETRDMLKALGRKGETYDDLIRRMIRELKES